MNYDKTTLRQLFQKHFDLPEWQTMLRTFFHATELKVEPERIDGTTDEEEGFYLGALDTTDSYRIGLFLYNIRNSHVARKRVGLRKLVKSFVNPTWGEFDAALVVFDDGNNWRLSFVCDIKGDSTAPKRYTFVFGDANNWYNTAVSRFVELQSKGVSFANLKEAFSVEALTKEFYNKLYNWFLWAKDKRSGVTFPNNIDTDSDDRDKMEVKMIRLITRMLFVWFIKQKHLVPGNLFDMGFLATILRDFRPEATDNGDYYNAILQNLFFATLNQEKEGRKLLTTYKNKSPYYSNKQLYRDTDKSYFTFPMEEREKHIKGLFDEIPYLNGGLFECLDKYELDENDKIKQVSNYDGFSHENIKSPNGNFKKKAFIPNALFFAAEHHETITVKEATNDKPEETQDITVMGLIELFKQYNFTVEENTTSDVEVSLDPELLGRVFENLLAAYNPETQESARKSTGSYYTPREIVDYMVEESLIAYLSGECGHDEAQMRGLVKGDTHQAVAQPNKVIEDLKNIKVLDPACGSGAFPMGMLLKITDIIERLTPEGKFNRYDTKLEIIKKCIYGVDIQAIAMLICKLRFFISLICDCEKDSTKDNFGIIPLPNLETKFVAANSLLPAKVKDFDDDWTQDSHLRQLQKELLELRQGIFDLRTHAAKRNNKIKDREKCLEIKAYIRQNATQPNAEKVALLEKQIADCEAQLPLYEGECWVEEMISTQTSLFEAAEPSLFRRDVNKEKRDKLQADIKKAKAALDKEQNKTVPTGFEAAVDEVTEWDPYNQNAVAPFFDAEWMFGIGVDASERQQDQENRPSKQGFDIVIGNPPYVEAKKLKSQSTDLKKNFTVYKGTADLSIYFVELGLRNLNSFGNLCFITTNKFFNTDYGKLLRKMILCNTITHLINFEQVEVFEGVLVSSVILGVSTLPKSNKQFKYQQFYKLNNEQFKKEFVAKQASFGFFDQSNLDEQEWSFAVGEKALLKKKLEAFKRIKDIEGVHVYRGVTTGYNPAFIITNEQRDSLIAQDTKNVKVIKNLLQGRNIRKWYYNESDENLIFTRRGIDIRQYPIIENYLKQFSNQLKPKKKSDDPEGRKPGTYKWYEILDNTAYYPHFEKSEKIIWGLTADKWAYTLDTEQHYLPSNGYILTSDKLPVRFILGLLNSKLLKHYFSYIGVMTAGGAYTLKAATIEALPIPSSTPSQRQPVIDLVNQILSAKKANPNADTSEWERQIDALVYDLYGLNEDEIRIIEG